LDETESSFAWMKVKTIKKEERAAVCAFLSKAP